MAANKEPPARSGSSESSPAAPAADNPTLRQARVRLEQKRQIDPLSLASQGVDALIEELRIHQVELELQNHELQAANLKLAESRDWFEALFEGSPIPHVLLDKSLVVRQCNLAASEYFGFSRRQLTMRPLTPLLAATIHAEPPFVSGLTGRFFGSNAHGVIPATVTVHQEVREVQLRYRRIPYGGIDMALVAIHDITDERKLQAQLHAARSLAESALKAKTQFLANISHELRSPLTSIIGYLDLMLAGVRPAEHPEMLRTARNGAMHLLGTVSDLLELSNLEAGGGLQLRPSSLDLAALCRQAHAMLVPQADAKGLQPLLST